MRLVPGPKAWVLTEQRELEDGDLSVLEPVGPLLQDRSVVPGGEHGFGAVGRTDPAAGGLTGMRHRVVLFGGSMVSGGRPEGGYSVHVRLPVQETT